MANPVVAVRLPVGVVERMDERARLEGSDRSSVARDVLVREFVVEEAPSQRPSLRPVPRSFPRR